MVKSSFRKKEIVPTKLYRKR